MKLSQDAVFRTTAGGGLGFGAEEVGDLLGEAGEGWAAVGCGFVVVGEAVAPDLLEDGLECGDGDIASLEVSDGGEDGFFFGLVLVGGGTLGEVAFGVGGAN